MGYGDTQEDCRLDRLDAFQLAFLPSSISRAEYLINLSLSYDTSFWYFAIISLCCLSNSRYLIAQSVYLKESVEFKAFSYFRRYASTFFSSSSIFWCCSSNTYRLLPYCLFMAAVRYTDSYFLSKAFCYLRLSLSFCTTSSFFCTYNRSCLPDLVSIFLSSSSMALQSILYMIQTGVLLILVLGCSCQVFRYGIHQPQGTASVDYLYSESGTWKNLTHIEYIWNYYNWSDNPPSHPYDKNKLISYADGTRLTTCRDANKHLLLDFNHDGQIDRNQGAGAFHQHNGMGVNNTKRGQPFSNFWFDDNSLATVLSKAYDRQLPDGLSEYKDFTRWRIMTGNHSYWKLYNMPQYLDTVSLDGIYHISQKEKTNATSCFEQALILTNASYDGDLKRFNYMISENYKLGLLAVFTSFLFEYTNNVTHLHHYMSLRSHLLTKLQKNPDNSSQFYSWMVFNNTDESNLFNTETMVLGSLGLSAGASFIYQVRNLNNDNFIDDTQSWLLSARVGQSKPGYMAKGINFKPKSNVNYTVEFILRCFNNTPSNIVAKLEITEFDGFSVNTKLLRQQDFQPGIWTKFSMDFIGTQNAWDFSLYWTGISDMDAAVIRVKQPISAEQLM